MNPNFSNKNEISYLKILFAMELLMQNKGSIKNLESGFQPSAVNRPDIGHQDEGHQGARHQDIKEPDIKPSKSQTLVIWYFLPARPRSVPTNAQRTCPDSLGNIYQKAAASPL